MKHYTLTKRDKTYLMKIGYREDDMPYIERASNRCRYEYINRAGKEKSVSRSRTIELVGKQSWLSGIGRAAFHSSAARSTRHCDQGGVPYILFMTY